MTEPTECRHSNGPARSCWMCARANAAAEREQRLAADVAWFERTGHCGGCGQPAAYCVCTDRRPCGCRDLHPMGGGLDDDALATFAVPVDDNQPELFDA